MPVTVDKDWVHMDKMEYDKLEWMKDLPPPSAGDHEVSMGLNDPDIVEVILS